MAVSVILCALPKLLFVLIKIICCRMYWYYQWQIIIGGLEALISSVALVAVCAIAGFIATKKIDGANKFLGAHKTALTVVNIFSSVVLGIIYAIIYSVGPTMVASCIAEIIVGIPVLILTAVIAVALINLFDMGLNIKKKSKKAPAEEKAAEVKEETAADFEEAIEEIAEVTEEAVEISAE